MRILGMVFLVLIALFVGGCGAVFSIMELFSNSGLGISVISIPSLLVGVLAGIWAWRIYKRPPSS
jgi:hypothetical protein